MTDEGAARPDEVLRGLQYIADSPPHEHGGFHPEAVKTAKAAIELIQGASSSNAAPERKLWLQSINETFAQLREWANTEAKRAETAEAEVAALQQELEEARNQRNMVGKCADTYMEEADTLRDSRDRLQEALRQETRKAEALLKLGAALGDPERKGE